MSRKVYKGQCIHNVTMETCKHENKKRLYERGEGWKSIPIYKCQDCGELIEIELKKVEVKKNGKQ